jgi:hypothetical protein
MKNKVSLQIFKVKIIEYYFLLLQIKLIKNSNIYV